MDDNILTIVGVNSSLHMEDLALKKKEGKQSQYCYAANERYNKTLQNTFKMCEDRLVVVMKATLDCKTIIQPGPDKQQLPQSTDNECKAII